MGLPAIKDAALPESYTAARTALQACSRIDECKSWADKAEALASYAKQAEDDALRKMADRIQARAIRRCGELLKQIEPNKGGRPATWKCEVCGHSWPVSRGECWNCHEGIRPETKDAADHSLSRKQTARDAGLSERQQKTALRVANVPEDEFEKQVESDNPPTVTALADVGTEKRSVENFQRATAALGTLERFASFCQENTAGKVASGLLPHEIANATNYAVAIREWLRMLVAELEE